MFRWHFDESMYSQTKSRRTRASRLGVSSCSAHLGRSGTQALAVELEDDSTQDQAIDHGRNHGLAEQKFRVVANLLKVTRIIDVDHIKAPEPIDGHRQCAGVPRRRQFAVGLPEIGGFPAESGG